METHKATIKRGSKKTTLVLNTGDQDFEITLTEDNPEEIKKVFNGLLKKLKEGQFDFQLNDSNKDLYQDISREYIKQLNSELINAHKELADYGLL